MGSVQYFRSLRSHTRRKEIRRSLGTRLRTTAAAFKGTNPGFSVLISCDPQCTTDVSWRQYSRTAALLYMNKAEFKLLAGLC